MWCFQIILRTHISLYRLSLRVSGVKWNFIVAVRYDVVAFIMSWLWEPFHDEHKLLPRALGLAWQMKSECVMVEMAIMRTEEKQTELMEPTVRWGAQELSSSPPPLLSTPYTLLASLCTSTIQKTKYFLSFLLLGHKIQRKFWEMWTIHGHTDQTSASLDCKNSSTFSFDGWNEMKDGNWDRKLCFKGPLQIELVDGQRPACRLLSHDRCRS